MKFKNSNVNETHKLKLCDKIQKLILAGMKLKNSNCDEAQKPKL